MWRSPAARVRNEPDEGAMTRDYPVRMQHVTINGHDVAYRTAGDGPVVLLVHGMAGSAATWKHVMPALAERFTVVAPDLLGHGESAKPAGEYSLGAHANGLRDLLNALGHERATCVGQSFGGGVVMQFAYQFP
jgi:pimeloyl-ACP methyl ester carboxylesterase